MDFCFWEQAKTFNLLQNSEYAISFSSKILRKLWYLIIFWYLRMKLKNLHTTAKYKF
jgi:hypothetical protein